MLSSWVVFNLPATLNLVCMFVSNLIIMIVIILRLLMEIIYNFSMPTQIFALNCPIKIIR